MKFVCMILTITRLILVPVIAILFFQNKWAAFFVFIIAAMTDYFDGKIARKYNASSELGQIMDPIVDKVLVITTLILLITVNFYVIFPGLIIIWREIIINDFKFSNREIKTSNLAKAKTTLQMLAVGMLLLPQQSYIDVSNLGLLTLWISAVLSIITGISYFIKNRIS